MMRLQSPCVRAWSSQEHVGNNPPSVTRLPEVQKPVLEPPSENGGWEEAKGRVIYPFFSSGVSRFDSSSGESVIAKLWRV
jgi:hypothetical protein